MHHGGTEVTEKSANGRISNQNLFQKFKISRSPSFPPCASSKNQNSVPVPNSFSSFRLHRSSFSLLAHLRENKGLSSLNGPERVNNFETDFVKRS